MQLRPSLIERLVLANHAAQRLAVDGHLFRLFLSEYDHDPGSIRGRHASGTEGKMPATYLVLQWYTPLTPKS